MSPRTSVHNFSGDVAKSCARRPFIYVALFSPSLLPGRRAGLHTAGTSRGAALK